MRYGRFRGCGQANACRPYRSAGLGKDYSRLFEHSRPATGVLQTGNWAVFGLFRGRRGRRVPPRLASPLVDVAPRGEDDRLRLL